MQELSITKDNLPEIQRQINESVGPRTHRTYSAEQVYALAALFKKTLHSYEIPEKYWPGCRLVCKKGSGLRNNTGNRHYYTCQVRINANENGSMTLFEVKNINFSRLINKDIRDIILSNRAIKYVSDLAVKRLYDESKRWRLK